MLLQDKIIIVTGSTKGIGRGIAKLLAAEGAKLVVSGRNAADGISVVQEIKALGSDAIFCHVDVSRAADCIRLADTAVAHFGRIDGLVNNAGIFPHLTLMETTEEVFDDIMAVNVKGSFFCTQRVLYYMSRQHSGSIVNIGSGHWDIGAADLAAYAVSKGALHTLTQHTSEHFARDGVRCNWVTVGWVWSPGELASMQARGEYDEEKIAAHIRERIPLGRVQTEEDIAQACIYFLSDLSTQVTGSNIAATGGFRV